MCVSIKRHYYPYYSIISNYNKGIIVIYFLPFHFFIPPTKCVFGTYLKSYIILPFSLFLLLFMSSTTLFGTIHGSHCIISANFYLYLQYFQKKVFNFSKISRSRTDPRWIISLTSPTLNYCIYSSIIKGWVHKS